MELLSLDISEVKESVSDVEREGLVIVDSSVEDRPEESSLLISYCGISGGNSIPSSSGNVNSTSSDGGFIKSISAGEIGFLSLGDNVSLLEGVFSEESFCTGVCCSIAASFYNAVIPVISAISAID